MPPMAEKWYDAGGLQELKKLANVSASSLA
jgi:hypothetical protein